MSTNINLCLFHVLTKRNCKLYIKVTIKTFTTEDLK